MQRTAIRARALFLICKKCLVERRQIAHDVLDRYFDAMNYFDLAATYQMMDNVTLRAGVNNVFDSDPPLSYSVGTTGNGNTYPQLYDALGRYFFFGITANF